MKPTFEQVKEFFVSWGLVPSVSYETGDTSVGDDTIIGNANGECVINTACYERMAHEAHMKYGEQFRTFVSRTIDAIDGEFYITAETWDELKEAWEK